MPLAIKEINRFLSDEVSLTLKDHAFLSTLCNDARQWLSLYYSCVLPETKDRSISHNPDNADMIQKDLSVLSDELHSGICLLDVQIENKNSDKIAMVQALLATRHLLERIDFRYSQQWFIDRISAAGYAITSFKTSFSGKIGFCYGITHMALFSVIAKDIKTFYQRLETIHRLPISDFKNNFAAIRERRQKHIDNGQTKEADEISALLIDFQAFFDSISGFQLPENLLRDTSRFDDSKTISIFVPSCLDNKEKRPFITQAFTGAYDKDELMIYLSLLKQYLGRHSFSLCLGCQEHIIKLSYDHESTHWLMVDAEKLPGEEYIHLDLLVDALMDSFSDPREPQQGLVMLTQLYATEENAVQIEASFIEMQKSSEWLQIHEVSLDKINKVYLPDNKDQIFYLEAIKLKDLSWIKKILSLDSDPYELTIRILNNAVKNSSVTEIISLCLTKFKMSHPGMYEKALEAAAIIYDENALISLYTTDQINPNSNLLNIAIYRGQIYLIQWYLDRFQPPEYAFITACLNNKVDILKLLIQRTKPTDALKVLVLDKAVDNNIIDVVNLLINDMGVNPTEDMLKKACIDVFTNIEIIKLLIEKIPPTEDIFYRVCINGKLKVAKLLIKKVPLMITVPLMKEIFVDVCSRGKVDIDFVQFLIIELRPSIDVLKSIYPKSSTVSKLLENEIERLSSSIIKDDSPHIQYSIYPKITHEESFDQSTNQSSYVYDMQT